MRLEALLTVGWKDDPQDECSATRLHETAGQGSDGYETTLGEVVRRLPADGQILGLERLFRRRTGGFKPIKQFVDALVSLPHPDTSSDPLVCRIDAFAYAFLKMAKNFDFLLPPSPKNSEFPKIHAAWSETIKVLENFERVGEPLPAGAAVTADQYLVMREIISRPSARDELRSLAALLLSGPSTLEEISKDLGLNYTLGQRTLMAFENIGVVERRPGNAFTITDKDCVLPLAVFCLRETIGIDFLSVLLPAK